MPASIANADIRTHLLDALAVAPPAGEVLIAGAGIGGLAAALALARRGIASHVLERRTAFSEQGAGIQIGPNGTRILQALGVAEALRPHAGVPQWLVVQDAASGAELTRMALNPAMEARFGAPYWAVHREDLHAALLMQVRATAKIRVTLDAEAIAAAETASAAGVITRDGRCFTGAVLIGADGLRSNIRREICADVALQPAGKSAFRAVFPATLVAPALLDGTRIWLGPKAHVVHYTVRAGAELAVIVIVEDAFAGEGWSHEADPRPLVAQMALAPALKGLLSTPATWRKWALATLPHAPTMAHGRIALLGDAAHPVLPFLAQGGVLALEDAVVLADVLASGEHDAPGALLQYQRQRQPRAERVAAASSRNGRIYHLTGVAAHARNAAMRLLPADRLIATYDWIYGWRSDRP